MQFLDYIITEKTVQTDDIFTIVVKPINSNRVFDFNPGQFAHIKNPLFENQNESHPFSITSSPQTTDKLEFCIRSCGDWTNDFAKLSQGAKLQIAGPFGKFIWDDSLINAVFLAGGVGIAPIISMLRTIMIRKTNFNLLLIYGNRTEKTIVYRKELGELGKKINSLRIVHVLSEIPVNDPWDGYRGFVTPGIIKKEVNLSLSPTFFICGPPIFITKMKDLLRNNFSIEEQKIKSETI